MRDAVPIAGARGGGTDALEQRHANTHTHTYSHNTEYTHSNLPTTTISHPVRFVEIYTQKIENAYKHMSLKGRVRAQRANEEAAEFSSSLTSP